MSDRKLRVGEWVEVRSKEEILSTLDENGQLDSMPFMPEMLSFCGKRFRVHKSAHKTCDTVFPIRSRRIDRTVHLQTRCDGQAHGGCQAGCLLFWKEAWLKPVEESAPPAGVPERHSLAANLSPPANLGCTEEALLRATRSNGAGKDVAYICQATRLPYATQDLSPFEVRQYVEDYLSGNVGLGQWLRGMLYLSYSKVINLGVGLGKPMRSLYDGFQRLRGGTPYPRYNGRIPTGMPTPTGQLDLREGELVRVKSYEEILATCNTDNRNRGMFFDAEMVPYCGGTYRVHKRVTQILDEKTGRMLHMKNPCIILEDVFCRGWYSECRMFCARAIYPYWREIWLERVPAGGAGKRLVSDGTAKPH